jgi:ABC-type uncharacterized transport system substrate-binding protein
VQSIVYFRKGLLIASLLASAAMGVVLLPYARANEIVVLSQGDSAFESALVSQLSATMPSVHVYRALVDIPQSAKLIVSVGADALREVVASPLRIPVLATYITRATFRDVVSKRKSEITISALFADPILREQLRLVKSIYQRPVSLGVLISPLTKFMAQEIVSEGHRVGIEVIIQEVVASDPSEGIPRADLSRALAALKSADAILAIPNPNIYTAANLRYLLLSTYRSNQALIGFSSGMVSAGAIATTWSSPQYTAQHLIEIIDSFVATNRLTAPQSVKYFSTEINLSVARSLSLIVDERVTSIANKP